MTPSILGHLDRLADEHPDKLLYSYLDVNGDPLESYTYASFLQRVEAIAGHLWKEGRFAAGDRLLLAYPPGLEMICAFFGCVRAGLIPVPVYPPSSRGCDFGPTGCRSFEDFVSPVHLGFHDGTQGRDRNPREHSEYVSAGDRPPLAGRRVLASAVSRYGIDRLLPVSSTERWHDVRVFSHGLHSAADPVVRCNDGLSRHGDGCAQFCLRLLPARRQAFQGEPGGL